MIGGELTGSPFTDDSFNGMIDEVGIYNRALSADQVDDIYDAGPNGKFIPSGETFTVTLGGTHLITSAPPGSCTFRDALFEANKTASIDTINFAANITGNIDLTSVLQKIYGDVSIDGPGADSLTIRRGTAEDFRIFEVRSDARVSMAGLTVTNGRAPSNGFGRRHP